MTDPTSMPDRAGEFCIAMKRIMRHPMRARGWSLAVLLALSTSAAAEEPKPKPVDISAIRDKLVVLKDGDGAIYVVYPGKDHRVWYGVGGKNKNRYEQIVIGYYSDGSTGAFDVSVWAPRVPNVQPGGIERKADGTYRKTCGSKFEAGLTELGGTEAKAIVDKGKFLSSALIRRPYLLARDDSAVYYYVDVIREQKGGKGSSLVSLDVGSSIRNNSSSSLILVSCIKLKVFK